MLRVIGLCLLTAIVLISCSEDKVTTPKEIVPIGFSPRAPAISSLSPVANEPKRGMQISITDNSDNENGFRLERKRQGSSFEYIATLTANATSYTDWGLDKSTTYSYRVRAYNQNGDSEWSSEKSKASPGSQNSSIQIAASIDARVQENSPNTNYGSSSQLFAAIWSSSYAESYIGFKYNLIPDYATGINSASMVLTAFNLNGYGTPLVYLEDLAIDWSEYTVNWNTRPFGRGIIIDYKTIENNGQAVNWNITSIVRSCFNGTTINHGIMIYVPSGEGEAVFHSRESTDQGKRPYVNIEYEW